MLQKNTVTIVFILMFFVLIYYVYSTRKDAAEAAKKAAEEKAKANANPVSSTTQPPVAQPPVVPTPTGGYTPPSPTQNNTGGGNTGGSVDEAKQLNTGSKGASVVALQNKLNALGYKDSSGKALTADGSYGPKTKYAHDAAMKAVPTTNRSINAIQNLGTASASVGQIINVASNSVGSAFTTSMLFDPFNPLTWLFA